MPELLRIFLGDFFGTAVLILLGNGVNASMSYNKMFAMNTGKNWVAIALGWGLAVLLGVIVAGAIGSGAHLNPAVTVLFWVRGDYGVAAAFVYMTAQMLGAILGQVVLNLITMSHAKESSWETIRSCHCTAPAYPKSHIQNFSTEFIGTSILLGALLSFGASGVFGTFGPVIVMLIVVSIGLSLGSSTGYAINPARDLAPRLVYFAIPKNFLDSPKASSNWWYSWIPVTAPISAAIILGVLSRFIEV